MEEDTRSYYERNKERLQQAGREYHYKNREKQLAYGREYYQNNKKRLNANRNARAKGLPTTRIRAHLTVANKQAKLEQRRKQYEACKIIPPPPPPVVLVYKLEDFTVRFD